MCNIFLWPSEWTNTIEELVCSSIQAETNSLIVVRQLWMSRLLCLSSNWLITSFENKPLNFSLPVCISRSHWNTEHQFGGARPQPAIPAAPSQSLQAVLRLPGQVLWIPLWCQRVRGLQGSTPVSLQMKWHAVFFSLWCSDRWNFHSDFIPSGSLRGFSQTAAFWESGSWGKSRAWVSSYSFEPNWGLFSDLLRKLIWSLTLYI